MKELIHENIFENAVCSMVVNLSGPQRVTLKLLAIENKSLHKISIGILMLKIRRSRDRLIFSMGIPIPGKRSLYWNGSQPARFD